MVALLHDFFLLFCLAQFFWVAALPPPRRSDGQCPLQYQRNMRTGAFDPVGGGG